MAKAQAPPAPNIVLGVGALLDGNYGASMDYFQKIVFNEEGDDYEGEELENSTLRNSTVRTDETSIARLYSNSIDTFGDRSTVRCANPEFKTLESNDPESSVPESNEAVASGVNKERHCLNDDGLHIFQTKVLLREASNGSSIDKPKCFRHLSGMEDRSLSQIAQASYDCGNTKANQQEEVLWMIPSQLLEREQSQISVLDFFPIGSDDSSHYSDDSSCYSSDNKFELDHERIQLMRILTDSTHGSSNSDEDIVTQANKLEGGEQELGKDTLMVLVDILAEEHKARESPSEQLTYGEADKKKENRENPKKQLTYEEADKKKKVFKNLIQKAKGIIRSLRGSKKLV